VIVDGSDAEQAVLKKNQAAVQAALEKNPSVPPVYQDVSPTEDIGVQWHFSSMNDFQDNNHLSRDGKIYLLQNSVFTGGTEGPGYVSFDAHNFTWKDGVNIAIDVVAVSSAIALSVALPGVGGILAGAALGFGVFEGGTAVENWVTVRQG